MRRTLTIGGLVAAAATAAVLTTAGADQPSPPDSTTPIKHVVVLFDENISFDHYFGTYPKAANPSGEPGFTAAAGTPTPNGLSSELLTHNPNTANPVRLGRARAVTCDQDHTYGDEQKAADGGAMDKFVQYTAGGSCADKSVVMDYYDGNTVTGLWNLAQHYAMNDNSFGSGFGPSTPGALELVSGQTHGTTAADSPGNVENNTVIADPNPAQDDCGSGGTITMTGKNVGDLMNAKHVTWGWFQGGFRPTKTAADNGGTAVCGAAHDNVAGASAADYSSHHEPFEYYASTRNQHHLPPSSPDKIGQDDQANHQYDLSDFDTAVKAGNLPQVSFLKAPEFQDGHAGYSDPLDEQTFIANEVNAIEASPQWKDTAIVIAYDDSDGWYDHQMGPLLNGSTAASDALNGVGQCGTGATPHGSYGDRCGVGPRLPLLVISPYAKQNAIDSTQTEQTSVLKFIEDNWSLGRIGDESFDARAGTLSNMFDFGLSGSKLAPKVTLDPSTGQVTSVQPTLPVSTGGGTTTPGTTPPPATTPVPAKPGSTATVVKTPKLKLTVKRSGRKLTAKLKLSSKLSGKAKVRIRLVHGSKVLATASATLSGTSKTLKLTARKTLAKGTYRLNVTVTRASGGKALTTRLTVKVR